MSSDENNPALDEKKHKPTVLKFEKKNIREMNRGQFVKYYNDRWFPFMKEVYEYGQALNKLAEMLGLSNVRKK